MKAQTLTANKSIELERIEKSMQEAGKKIAPVWPLENFVAVNPYMGMADQKFDSAAQQLANIAGIQMTLPISFYLEKLKSGEISTEDLQAALWKKSSDLSPAEFEHRILESKEEETVSLVSLADVAGYLTEKDWKRFVISRISTWAASYFDSGQARWKASNQHEGLFAAWKTEARVDLTPEISGLKGFRKFAKQLPDDPMEAVKYSLSILDFEENETSVYFHKLLLKVGGWSAYAARLDWEANLYGGEQGKLMEFLAVLVCWEACLFQCLDSPRLRVKWLKAKRAYGRKEVVEQLDQQTSNRLILQDALDRSTQRRMVEKINSGVNPPPTKEIQAKAQAIFCIDVRSEVFRRNLEIVDQEVETLGFAGFFAFPINYVPIGRDKGEAQCPVLIKSGPTILEEIPEEQANKKAREERIFKNQIKSIWKSFRSGAVTCFSFVSPIGLSYLPKLFTDSFGLTRPAPHPEKDGLNAEWIKQKGVSLKVSDHNNQTAGIPIDQQVEMARNALAAMSLTSGFAQFVLIVGHGSSSVNNPYATGLDCGACGGHSGEANARTAAAVLNNPEVRDRLKRIEINIPDTTTFLACLHDTTTDEISIFNEYDVPVILKEDLIKLKDSLAKAGHASRTERSLRLPTAGDVDAGIIGRSKDWSQVRPEWGLAGCSAFVVAPRSRTKHLNFEGRSFLHSYDWQKDEGFSILELIMTAPMVVTSWINLQYYASVADNTYYGSGNKALHNVTAGVGVLEGYSGDLRVGLPIQSVHDGEKFQHEPVRLNVIIEAPLEAMNEVLKKYASVKDLCDNEWIHLLAMNDAGKVSHRYLGDLSWEEIH